MKFGMRLATLAMATFLLAGCVTVPIIDVDTTGLSIPASVDPTMQQVKKAIYKGAVDEGWSVRRLTLGRLEAEIYVKRYKAVVRIIHDTKTFSIKYKDSRNLRYDGAEIRRAYNKWGLRLRRSILRQSRETGVEGPRPTSMLTERWFSSIKSSFQNFWHWDRAAETATAGQLLQTDGHPLGVV